MSSNLPITDFDCQISLGVWGSIEILRLKALLRTLVSRTTLRPPRKARKHIQGRALFIATSAQQHARKI